MPAEAEIVQTAGGSFQIFWVLGDKRETSGNLYATKERAIEVAEACFQSSHGEPL